MLDAANASGRNSGTSTPSKPASLMRGSKPKLDESNVADQMNVFTPNFISASLSFAVEYSKSLPQPERLVTARDYALKGSVGTTDKPPVRFDRGRIPAVH
jgi:hypothetical protein